MYRCAFCLLLGALPVSLPVFAADSPWLYGIHWYATDGNAEQMTGGKGVWIVENVNTYTSPTASAQQAKFQTAVNRGHTIIVRLQPRWGWCVPRESEMNSYLSAVSSVAYTLRNQVHIWQIGNEMDNYSVEYGDGYLPPEDYVSRFKRIRAAIKSVTSPLGQQIVILGPPTAFSPYLSYMLPYLDIEDLDGFAIHAYGITSPPNVANSLLNFQAAVTQQIGVIDGHAGGLFRNKPVFITEFDRCSDPASTEWVSAQFLHQAYAWLNGWNSNPANHPVTAAVWFVYPDDPNWGCFSLRRLMGGTRGKDNDVWDAFQYAASQDYPAGPMKAALLVGTSSLAHERFDLTPPPADTFVVANSGVGAMEYTISSDVPWLSVSPAAGVSSGERDAIQVNYNLAGYGYGTYLGTITVSAPALPSTEHINVSVAYLAKGDFDGDGDCDQEDFGRFQACYTGEGIPQPAPECRPAKLEGNDDDVDLADFAVFAACFSGPGVNVDPDCGN